jgi:hypothetical protein
MLIEVLVSGWEQHCCGKAFVRGSAATVSIVARDPSETEPDAPARFFEEHHGQTPADVLQRDVTGTVARITGVTKEQRRRPGPDPVFEDGDTVVSSADLDEVAARSTGGFGELRLLLELHDGTQLPGYVQSEASRAAAERVALDHERALLRRTDEVGVLLDAIADEAINAYSSIATIERPDDGMSVSIEPRSAGTAAVLWSRSASAEADVIAVRVGEGRFSFPADIEHASQLRELISAAAAGRVYERLHEEDDSTVLETMVESIDGQSWQAATTARPFRLGGGVVAMAGALADRLRAGDHGYEAWTTERPGVERH